MKKEVILQGLGWGHLPEFLIARELSDGRLRALTGRYLPGHVEEVVAARRSDRPHGPVAQRLWRYLRQEAGNWRKSLEADGSGRTGKRPRG